MALHAAVVGSGPNGLTAACRLARAGWAVTVYETAPTPGGAARSTELFGPGLISDLGASVLPFASPAYEALLPAGALDYLRPPIPAAHPLENVPDAAVLHRSLEQTAAELGPDAELWRWVIGPLANNWETVRQTFLSPRGLWAGLGAANRPPDALRSAGKRAAAFLQIGAHGAMPARNLMRSFRTARARALFAGMAAHSTGPLSHPLTSAFGVLFAAAGHAGGWPVIRGGSQQLVNALMAELEAHGGQVVTDFAVEGITEVPLPGLRQRARARKSLPRRGFRIDGLRYGSRGHRRRSGDEVADAVVLDLTPAQLLRFDGLRLTERTQRRMARWNYGPGIVKIDYLVDGPLPWAQPELARAGTVHLGGSAEQITASEAAANKGVLPGRPYVMLTQPSAADETRTPDHRTVCWAYAHVPHGLDAAGTAQAVRLIEQEISRFAPQFREAVLERKVWGPAELEAWNPNLVGGSVSSGLATPGQIFAGPAQLRRPYSLGVAGVYVCSAATPPGGGAHGMPGFNAAAAVLRDTEVH